MRIGLITGPCPPGECGVGDYTTCLVKALKANGADTSVVSSGKWTLLGVFETIKYLRAQKFDIVHIEYPTVGFGYKLGPQGLSLLQNCVVTIHEASQRRILRKLSLLPFSFRPEHIIFTSHFERQFATKWAPWIAPASSVIPVGSNILAATRESQRTLGEIVYFGLIIPRKELEQVLELAKLIKLAGLSLIIRVIGRVPDRYEAYFEELLSKATGLPIIWDRALNEEQVAERLASTSIAYLPYWDGASDRRTTLRAALLNGLAVITTRGPQTPRDLGRVVRFCQNSKETLAEIASLIRNPEEISRMRTKAVQYGERYSWESIAKLHLEIYHSVLRKRSSYNIVQAENRKVTG